MGEMGGEDAEAFQELTKALQSTGKLPEDGVTYDPYQTLTTSDEVLSIIKEGQPVTEARTGEKVEVILPRTSFYLAAGGQVADTGLILSEENGWQITVEDMRKPAPAIVSHIGTVTAGTPKQGDKARAQIDQQRRQDIMRNHTATHLLHAELSRVLGSHTRQAGSLVAPDRLRFDFNHPEAVSKQQLHEIEAGVNQHILANYSLKIEHKSLDEAKAEGARALFGEKYGKIVRTIQIGEGKPFSYELCGGTHVNSTGEIGIFLIVSEGSVASGIRRIEAITGRAAYERIQATIQETEQLAELLKANPSQLIEKANALQEQLHETQKELARVRSQMAQGSFQEELEKVTDVKGAKVLAANLPGADRNTLRQLTDQFRQKYSTGVIVLSTVIEEKPALIAAITDDLVAKGLKAGELIKVTAEIVGGSGGGRPNMAQAGGSDASRLDEALALVEGWVAEKLS
jgi:alanyl-tRNA synthetase